MAEHPVVDGRVESSNLSSHPKIMKLVNSEIKIKKPLVWLEVNKKNLISNLNQIKRLSSPAKIMAVVKANAYGLGAVGVARIIQKKADFFGVVGVKEAILLKKSGIIRPVVNLGIFSVDDSSDLVRLEIRPTIFTYVAARDLSVSATKLGKKVFLWIKIDTGLGRLGVPYSETSDLIKKISQTQSLEIEGIISTLTEDPDFDRIQLRSLLELKEKLLESNLKIPNWSLASSQALFLLPEARLDVVRTGLSIYGFYPSSAALKRAPIRLKKAIKFKTRIGCIKELEKGETAGYRRRFSAKRKTRIAVLLAGYSYGLDSRLANGGRVKIGRQTYPFIGQITMTNSFVSIGQNRNIKAGNEVEIEIPEACRILNQSEYEFLSRIPEKVERIYV